MIVESEAKVALKGSKEQWQALSSFTVTKYTTGEEVETFNRMVEELFLKEESGLGG